LFIREGEKSFEEREEKSELALDEIFLCVESSALKKIFLFLFYKTLR
jgi:hypothetical protein